MSIPAAVKSYHTAWLTPPGGQAHPVRYAVDGPRLICFGDDDLANVPDGSQVSVSIHEIAGGQSREAFSASLRLLPPDEVDMNTLAELLAHVPLGRTIEEVRAALDQRARIGASSSSWPDVEEHAHVAIDDVAAAVTIQAGAVVSKVVYRDETVNVTVFGFGAGEGLTEHRTGRPAVVQVLSGRLLFTANGEELDAEPGFWLYMPSGTPHALVAVEPTVMLLTLLRP